MLNERRAADRAPSPNGGGQARRAWPYYAATLYTLLAPGTVRAMNGFRPGLWAITTVFSGAMALTSRGDYCLRRIGPVATTTSDINGVQGLRGPVSVQVRRRPGTTIVTWGDRLQTGPVLTVDHGQDRFTRKGEALVYRGVGKRTQRIAGQTSVIHAILHGHWLGAQCPKTVGPGTFSSPTLAKLNAQVAKLAAIMHGEKAALGARQRPARPPKYATRATSGPASTTAGAAPQPQAPGRDRAAREAPRASRRHRHETAPPAGTLPAPARDTARTGRSAPRLGAVAGERRGP